jgi:4-aminobutyrate aminotransferase
VFLDFAAGIAVVNIGYNHPRYTATVIEQAKTLVHAAGQDYYNPQQIQIAEKLAEITPGTFGKRVFLSNSGTEANEAAIKATKRASKRPLFISTIGAFHGRTMGSVALSASKPMHKQHYMPLMPGVIHIPYAYCYRCPYKLEYPECGVWCGKFLKEVLFESLVPASDVAAVFLEPIQGEGGYVVPPTEYIQDIARTCKENGIAFVADEIQAGIGRTGKWFGMEHYDVEPDVVTIAKAIANGIPLGATVMRDTYDFGDQGAHANTYGGNMLACAAALTTLSIIEEERLLDNATRVGNSSMKRLTEWIDDYEIVGDVRGKGLMIGVEFVKDKKSKTPHKEAQAEMTKALFKRGLVVLPAGRSLIRIVPPLTITEDEMTIGLNILEDVVREQK